MIHTVSDDEESDYSPSGGEEEEDGDSSDGPDYSHDEEEDEDSHDDTSDEESEEETPSKKAKGSSSDIESTLSKMGLAAETQETDELGNVVFGASKPAVKAKKKVDFKVAPLKSGKKERKLAKAEKTGKSPQNESQALPISDPIAENLETAEQTQNLLRHLRLKGYQVTPAKGKGRGKSLEKKNQEIQNELSNFFSGKVQLDEPPSTLDDKNGKSVVPKSKEKNATNAKKRKANVENDSAAKPKRGRKPKNKAEAN